MHTFMVAGPVELTRRERLTGCWEAEGLTGGQDVALDHTHTAPENASGKLDNDNAIILRI